MLPWRSLCKLFHTCKPGTAAAQSLSLILVDYAVKTFEVRCFSVLALHYYSEVLEASSLVKEEVYLAHSAGGLRAWRWQWPRSQSHHDGQ